MKPIKLSIEGVFSYRKKQIIDFEKLSTGGVFGIFGKTGSGKSSIIEAIIFVLYLRLEKISGRQVDLINLQSDKAVIEFEFESFGKQYLATSITKRIKVGQTTKRTFYEKEDGNYRAVSEDKTVESIIGLSYDNFCRIVIIPQGKFQEFFSLSEGQRTSMLKEIFPLLSRYDLRKSLDSLRTATKEKLNFGEGRLNQLSEYTEEGLTLRKKESESLQHEYKKVEKENADLKRQTDENVSLLSVFENLRKISEEKKKIDEQKIQIDELKKELDEYESAVSRFQLPVSYFENVQKSIDESNKRLNESERLLCVLRERFAETKKIFDDLIEEDKKTAAQSEEIRKINTLTNLRKAESELACKKEKLQNEKSRSEKGDVIFKEQEKKKSFFENQIKDKESKRLNPMEFSAVRNWFWQKKTMNDAIAQMILDVQNTEKRRQEIFDAIGLSEGVNHASVLQNMFSKLQDEIRVCENLHSKYLVEQALCRYSEGLEENKPCPLCGSLSHPSPANMTDADSHLKQINERLAKLRSDSESLNLAINQLGSLNKQMEDKQKEIELQKERLRIHEEQFVWSNYKDKTFEQIGEMEKSDGKLQQEIAELRKQLDESILRLNRYSEELNKIRNAINSIGIEVAKDEGVIEQLNKEIDYAFKRKYSDFDEIQLNAIAENLNQEIAKRNQEIEKQNKEITKAETDINHYNDNLKRFHAEMQKSEQQLRHLLEESDFENLQTVKRILNKKLDVQTLRDSIEDFMSRKFANEKSYEELTEQTFGKQCPSQERIDELKAELERSNTRLKEILEHKGRIEGEATEFEKRLNEKKKLQAEFGKLEVRLNAMEELSQMFKGDKFVQFISTIYLEQLCSKANERFRIITQNKFEISYTDKNFEIIDYLNEGKKRSIKTLSGGQMFQASLCMALALVDTIRLNSNSNQDFFFIDEGFGTQDSESLELIFESLKALRQENKTVGLISHNETLKEKISGNVSVRFKNNEGSVIETNYL